MTRKPIYRDDNGKLYHSSVPGHCNLLNSYESKQIFHTVQTVERIHGMYLTSPVPHGSPK